MKLDLYFFAENPLEREQLRNMGKLLPDVGLDGKACDCCDGCYTSIRFDNETASKVANLVMVLPALKAIATVVHSSTMSKPAEAVATVEPSGSGSIQ